MSRRPRYLRDYRHQYEGIFHDTEEYVPGCLLCENEVLREALTKIADSEDPRQAKSAAKAAGALAKIKERSRQCPS